MKGDNNMKTNLGNMFNRPLKVTEEEYQYWKQQNDRIAAETAPNVAVRLNKRYQLEYYNTLTGEIVSCHY